MKKLKNLFLVLVTGITLSSCGYNSMVEKDEQIAQQWAQVENQYQRRSDLIPNLMNTVKGYADFEKSTLTAVVEARAKATSVQVNANDLNPESIKKFQAAQGELTGALSRLLVSVERYPDLKANQSFLELQAQLEGTENRISIERKRFNDAVGDYNSYIRKFPRNLYASAFDFEKKGYFEADKGSEKAPSVNFN
jgi:LemA protein